MEKDVKQTAEEILKERDKAKEKEAEAAKEAAISEDERLLREARERVTDYQKKRVQECVDEIGLVLKEYNMEMTIAGDIRAPRIIVIPKNGQ